MSATSAPSKRQHPARLRALEPYLEKLRGWSSNAAVEDLDRSARINVGPQQIVVEPWERQQLHGFFADKALDAECAELIGHGLAALVKSTFDIEQLRRSEHAPSAHIYAVQAELMLDVAIGTALLRETQVTVDDRVADGRVELAKGLSQFRHKLARGVKESKQCIAASEQQRAEDLVDSLTDVADTSGPKPMLLTASSASPTPAEPSPASIVEGHGPLEQTRPDRRARPRKKPEAAPASVDQGLGLPAVSTALAVILAVAFVAWLGLVALPDRFAEELSQPVLQDVPHGKALKNVVANYPSLYVQVDPGLWSQMTPAQREELIEGLGVAASMASYRGAQLTAPDGRPVARWLRDRGSWLVLEREDPVPPTVEQTPPPIDPS